MTDDRTEPMTRDRQTLKEMSHTNPYTGAVFGQTQTYSRGKTVAADGGEADAAGDPADGETLGDVDHTPADEVDGAQGSFDRGNEDTDRRGAGDE